MKHHWTGLVTENFSYKVVALFISLILWLTILGRRDFVMSKNIDIDLITGAGTSVVAQTADHVKVKVSGSRSALKKFMESSAPQTLTLDLAQRPPGVLDVDIPLSKIEVPLGVKILGIRPNQIQVEIVRTKDKTNDQQKSQ